MMLCSSHTVATVVAAVAELVLIVVVVVTAAATAIHLIPKWPPINYSFVCMLISPLRLIFASKVFCFLYTLTRRKGLINMQTKE